VPEDPTIHHVFDDDVASGYESAVVDGLGRDGDERIAVDRGGPDPRVASANAFAAGPITDRIEGKASHKDHAELRVAQYLVQRLNQLGEDWHDPQVLRASSRDERGVDCVARDSDGRPLQIQVTTTEREAWKQLADVLCIERSAANDAVVEAVRTAIDCKATQADPDVVLALDATDSVRAAFRSVAGKFRDQHGRWAAEIGFQEIWLVGPAVGLVHRLDAEG
jgi:hypothetical protein